MLAIASVVIVVLLSLIITRVATVVLTQTGLSRESARFQARSAFSGVGFTTSEAESLVNHPVRRRVVMTLMLLGSAGLVAVVASLVISFSRAGGEARGARLGVLLLALLAVFLLARSPLLDRALSRLVRRLIARGRFFDVHDYERLLDLAEGWVVVEMHVRAGSWPAGRTVADLALRDEGVALLGVHRGRADAGFLGVPVGEALIEPGDRLVIYGAGDHIAELGERPPGADGDARHADAVQRHRATAGVTARRESRAAGDGHTTREAVSDPAEGGR